MAGSNSDDQRESFSSSLAAAAAAASKTASCRKDLEIKTVHPPGGESGKSDRRGKIWELSAKREINILRIVLID